MDSGPVDDATRRTLLKSLGIVGSVTVGSASLGQVRAAMSSPTASDSLAATGASLQAELGDGLDAELLTERGAEFADAASDLGSIADAGVPEEQRQDFESVADVGRPIVEHLAGANFYADTDDQLPDFTTAYIDESVRRFANEANLAAPLEDLGFEDGDGVDLLASVSDKTDALAGRHWVGTDVISRDMVGSGDYVPPMTRGAHEGSLLWLQDLDLFLWQNAVLVTSEIYRDAVWYARALAAGFHLVTEGAIAVATDDDTYGDEQLAALLSVGFAVGAICDPSILQDVYWITDEERAPRRDDLEYEPTTWQ